MKIWELNSDDNSRELTYNKDKNPDENHPIYSDFDGTLKQSFWKPYPLENIKKGKYIDFPYFRSAVPVFLHSTYEKLGPFMQGQVEFLPVLHEEYDFYVINVINMIDCATFCKFNSKGIETAGFLDKKVKFIPEKIPEGTFIFKLFETRNTRVYVTDLFVYLVKKHKLKGFEFTELWDSEFTEEMELKKKQKVQDMLEEIERTKGPEFSYEEAVDKVKSGLAVASGQWKMQLDAKGRFWLGHVGEDSLYHWLMPTYMPPILLEYPWHEVGKSEI